MKKYEYSERYKTLVQEINATYERLPLNVANALARSDMRHYCKNNSIPGMTAMTDLAVKNVNCQDLENSLTSLALISIIQCRIEDCTNEILSDVQTTLNQILIRTDMPGVTVDSRIQIQLIAMQTHTKKINPKVVKAELKEFKQTLEAMGQDTCNDLNIYTDIEYCLDAIERITGKS